MTKEESETIIRYAMMIYPSFRLTEQQISNSASVWSCEFESETKDTVIQAFKLARAESPDWMPSIPKIQSMITTMKLSLKQKSKEQEFRDSHCGKSQDEWESCCEWEQSEHGHELVKSFKERLKSIISGGQYATK